MTETAPRLSVIIPNWNGARHLPECLESLRRQSHEDYEAVLVDNGSTDDSLSLVERDFPWVRIVRNHDNLGFSAAVNAGIRTTNSEYVVLLNNDTRASEDWLEQLVSAMDAMPEASFAACRMLRYDPPHRIDSAGDRFSLLRGGGVNIGAGEPAENHDQPAWVFGACAGAALYRRSLFADIGLFDEDFFLVFEDVDLSLRARVAGHRCLYVPEAVVYHKRGASTDVESVAVASRSFRNFIWVAGKNLPLPLLMLWVVLLGLRAVIELLGLLFAPLRRLLPGGRDGGADAGRIPAPPRWPRRFSALICALGEAMRTLPAKRRETASLRRLGSLALLPWLLRPVRPLQSAPDSS